MGESPKSVEKSVFLSHSVSGDKRFGVEKDGAVLIFLSKRIWTFLIFEKFNDRFYVDHILHLIHALSFSSSKRYPFLLVDMKAASYLRVISMEILLIHCLNCGFKFFSVLSVSDWDICGVQVAVMKATALIVKNADIALRNTAARSVPNYRSRR